MYIQICIYIYMSTYMFWFLHIYRSHYIPVFIPLRHTSVASLVASPHRPACGDACGVTVKLMSMAEGQVPWASRPALALGSVRRSCDKKVRAGSQPFLDDYRT